MLLMWYILSLESTRKTLVLLLSSMRLFNRKHLLFMLGDLLLNARCWFFSRLLIIISVVSWLLLSRTIDMIIWPPYV